LVELTDLIDVLLVLRAAHDSDAEFESDVPGP